MRVVLDTNVVVSGLLTETGVPAQVLDLFIASAYQVMVDERKPSRAPLRRR
ncbi:MAG: PIN domain-containing protein [Gemmatimonadaceae bacterium]